MKTTTKDLTKGTIWKQLIAFAIPLIWGNLFQLTYNMVDSIVVGQFAGQDALAAVGTSDPVMNLLILGVTGLCIGASVIMSNCFGAGKTEELKHEVGMTLLLVMGLSAIILLGGLIASEGILKLMQTPTDILPLAESYLHIIFIGMPFTCLYNIYAASLRSVGDAKTPVYFLVLASVLNGALDVLFVAGLHMGVAGAYMRQWFDQEIGTDTIIPVILFTHDPPIADTKHFTNPNGKHTINSVDKFQNLLADTCLVTDVKKKATKNWEKLEQFIHSHSMIKAYFHGDKNYNEFYTWNGVNGTIDLPVFRVDSPMKGEYSSADERLLSFIVVTMDVNQRLLTARECLWNTENKTSIQWGSSCTITF